MMKTFRKYNKQLIAIFMAMLMIVFVGGSAMQQWMAPSQKQLLAQSNLGEITSLDTRAAESLTRLLGVMGFNWRQPYAPAFPTPPIDLVDWVLLTRESGRMGMDWDGGALRGVMSEVLGPRNVDELARQFGIKPMLILEALAQYQAIRKTASAIAASSIPSEAELRRVAREALEKVRISAVVLPAQLFLEETAAFSEERTQEQFAKYRERERGEGMEFGYFVPDKVRLQYIRIDSEKLADGMNIANLETKARKYYEENRTSDSAFYRSLEQQASAASANPDEEPSPYMDWPEAKDIAVAAVRRQEAQELARRIGDRLIQSLGELWLDIPRGEDGYRDPPQEAKDPDHYAHVLDRLPPSLTYPQAVSVHTTVYFSREEANGVADIGKASFRPSRGSPQYLSTLAFRNEAIVREVPKDAANPNDYLALDQTCRYWLTDDAGNVYVFRVIDVAEAHVPESVDEVRDLVAVDLRLRDAFEEARARAEGLQSCVNGLSLKEAYESDAELVHLMEQRGEWRGGYFEPRPFSRVSSFLAARGRVNPKMYLDGIGFVPNEIVDQFFELEHAPQPLAVFELKERAALLIVRWHETIPGREDEFLTLREQLLRDIRGERARTVVTSWLDPDNIRARNGFTEAS